MKKEGERSFWGENNRAENKIEEMGGDGRRWKEMGGDERRWEENRDGERTREMN